MTRVALFARYSSKMQDELSLEAQQAEMERYCTQRGWPIVARFLLPETRSADIERSDEFQEMMSAAKRKSFDVLLLHRLDRFGRSREHAVLHKAALRRLGIQVTSVVENLDDQSMMDRAFEGMLEVMAEWTAASIGLETKKGHSQLVRKGYWTGGKVPWGLDVEETPDGHKRLIPDPQRAPVVRRLFEMVAEGARTGDGLDYVAEASGERWTAATFYTRIRNAVYCGRLAYGSTTMPTGRQRRKGDPEKVVQGRWEGLVSEETWERANQAINARGKAHSQKRKPRAFYMLSDGIMTCSKCGRPIIGGLCDGTRRYMCSARGRDCQHHSVKADLLEPLVLARVEKRLTTLNLDAIMADFEKTLQPRRDEAKRQEAFLRKKLTGVRKQLTNLVNAVANGMDIPEIREKLQTLKQEEATLAQDIGTCQLEAETSVRLNLSLVRSHVASTLDLFREATPEEMKILLQDLFRLEVDLQKQEGQLFFKLAPDRVPEARLSFGRSARICTFPSVAQLCLQTGRVLPPHGGPKNEGAARRRPTFPTHSPHPR